MAEQNIYRLLSRRCEYSNRKCGNTSPAHQFEIRRGYVYLRCHRVVVVIVHSGPAATRLRSILLCIEIRLTDPKRT